MAITLGAYTFPAGSTAVSEEREETGGRDARTIVLRGVVTGLADVDAVESELDAILAAASDATDLVPLSIRPGRVLMVQRVEFKREIERETATGSYRLELEAPDPYEEAASPSVVPWVVTSSGNTVQLAGGGNASAPALVTLTAGGSLISPSVSDGTRTAAYSGTVALARTLVFDGVSGRTYLDGDDVTPYVSGEMPRVDPDGSTFTYADDAASSHLANGSVSYTPRWW